MPRTPNASLEAKIIAAAMRLLDRGGEEAVTLRAVAKEAGTTTPTIYERFQDRDRLMRCLARQGTEDFLIVFTPCKSVEAIFSAYLRESQERPNRVAFSVRTFGERYVAGDKMPVFDLLKSKVTQEVGATGSNCEELALAIASLAFGTTQGMLAAGIDTHHAVQFQRSATRALRMLLAAFGKKSSPLRHRGQR